MTSLASCTGQPGRRRRAKQVRQANRGQPGTEHTEDSRHRQDPARRGDHAGEPVLRLGLGTFRCRRHPGQERPVHGVRADRGGGLREPYHDPRDVNGGGPHSFRHNATVDVDGGKMDGSVRNQADHQGTQGDWSSTGTRGTPACSGNLKNPARRDGVGMTLREIPDDGHTPSRSFLQDHIHVPAGRIAGACFPSTLCSMACRELVREKGCSVKDDQKKKKKKKNEEQPPKNAFSSGGRSAETLEYVLRGLPGGEPASKLRLDGPHVPAAQARRQLGDTTCREAWEPDCEDNPTMHDCAPVNAERQDARPSGTRCRTFTDVHAGRPARQTSSR